MAFGSRDLTWFLAAALCAAGLTACTDPNTTPDDDDDDVVEGEFDVTIELSDHIETVASVTWTTEVGDIDAAVVEFGRDGFDMSAPVDLSSGSPYQVWLVGMKPDTAYDVRVAAESGGTTYVSETHALTTGPRPNNLPDLDVDAVDAGASQMMAGGFLLTSIFAAPATAVIVDGDGDYVWWHEAPDDFPVSRTRLSPDARWVYFWTVNLGDGGPQGDQTAPQELFRVSIDGSVEESFDLPDGHHDFFQLPDGTIAYIEYDVRNSGGQDVYGDRIVELDPDTGTTTEVYSIWDDFEYSGGGGGPGPGGGEHWSHANALRYDPDEDAYYMGFRVFCSIIKVGRTSGDLHWVLGGDDNDFSGGQNIFESQHGFQITDGGLVVFDNGDPDRGYSQVLQLTLDEGAMTVDQEWSYLADPSAFSFSLGDVLRLPNGNSLADYSTGGQMDEFTAGGDLVWRMNAALGGAFGYAHYMEDLYDGLR